MTISDSSNPILPISSTTASPRSIPTISIPVFAGWAAILLVIVHWCPFHSMKSHLLINRSFFLVRSTFLGWFTQFTPHFYWWNHHFLIPDVGQLPILLGKIHRNSLLEHSEHLEPSFPLVQLVQFAFSAGDSPVHPFVPTFVDGKKIRDITIKKLPWHRHFWSPFLVASASTLW